MTTKEIKNWEWIKSVEVQYMGFLTQYLGTATDSKGFVELMKQLRLDEAIAYLKDDLGKDSSEPSYYKFRFYTKNTHTRNYFLLIDSETQTRNWAKHSNVSYQISDGRMYRP